MKGGDIMKMIWFLLSALNAWACLWALCFDTWHGYNYVNLVCVLISLCGFRAGFSAIAKYETNAEGKRR